MNKEKILYKLAEIPLDQKDYIIIGGAALVLQDMLEMTSDIDLACSKEVYEQLDLLEKVGAFQTKIKYWNCFEIGTNFYDLVNIDLIEGYQVANLEACYELKVLEGRKKDKKLLANLDLCLSLRDNYRYERKLRKQGVKIIAGVDEVGRGPLVGPVVAACVILPEQFSLPGLTDSKKLSEKKREEYYQEIMQQALSVGVGIIDEQKIDEVNIYEATKLAMKKAIEELSMKPEHILIDAMPLQLPIPTTSIIKGDLKSVTIAAASVIAKVTRDHMLYQLDEKYPMYDFKNNKGYPTKKHLAAIQTYGILKEHRRSYGPVREYLQMTKN